LVEEGDFFYLTKADACGGIQRGVQGISEENKEADSFSVLMNLTREFSLMGVGENIGGLVEVVDF